MRYLLLLSFLALAHPAQAQITHVRAGASGAQNGSSWHDAFADLQAALAATSAGEIWVAAGAYTPAPPGGDPNASFALQSGLALYGGFAGTESVREQRRPDLNLTILSGDLNGDDGPSWSGRQENSDHVLRATGVDATAILDGFVVSGGYSVNSGGAGIRIENGSPTLRAVSIEGCVSNWSFGGGVSVIGSGSPTFTGCAFRGNYAHLTRGGGLSLDTGCRAALDRCRFENNLCTGSGSQAPDGGAIYLHLGSALAASDCSFHGNVAEFLYGASGYPGSGGAISSLADTLELRRCLFLANRSDAGGALYLYRGANSIESCAFNANRAVKQAPSGGYGGALVNAFSAQTAIDGCTFLGNRATEDAGGIWADSSTSTCDLVNSIAWGNTDTSGQVGESQLKGTHQRFCCVMNMLVPRPGEDPIDPSKFSDCTDADPLFVDADGPDDTPGTADDDLRLLPASPCLDAGDPTTLNTALDLGGALRLIDGDLDAVLRVDMGAHEFAPVRLEMTLAPIQGGGTRVSLDLSGQAGLAAFLVLGRAGTPFVLEPFGAMWVDPLAFVFLPLGQLPASLSLSAPPGNAELVLQALGAGALSAAFSNPLELRLLP